MNAPMHPVLARRSLLAAGAGLFVAFAGGAARGQTMAPGAPTGPTPTNLVNPPVVGVDGLLAIRPDGHCEVLTSKTEFGQGIRASLAQIAAEELDLPFEMVEVPHPDTNRVPDHGLTAGSLTLQIVGPRVRRAAATARAALARMGAERLGVGPDAVETMDGVVRVTAEPGRSITYAELIGGRRFDLDIDAEARVKDPSEWRVAGRDVRRTDVMDKMTGGGDYIHNFRLPEMLHARVLHPARVGAVPKSVDEASIAGIPARVLRKNNLIAVVAEREWHAVRAARDLKVEWSEGTSIPSMDRVYDAARQAPVERADTTVDRGDPTAALGEAARRLEAEYRFGVQTHGTIGPSCAVGQYENGRLTLHSGSQAPFDVRTQVAHILGLSREVVRVVYHHSSGCFGRNGLEDATAECAVLAMELAPRPVRLQWMRHDEHAAEPKAPPVVMALKGGVTSEGRMAAWDAEGWVPHSTMNLVRTTAAEMLGTDDGPPGSGNWHANSNPPYDGIPAARTVMHRIRGTPFRPSWIRTPGRLQNCFAVESFTDELAAAAGKDPIAFRLDHLSDARGRAVIEAAARAANWDGRPSPRGGQDGPVRRGRGFAYIRYDNNRTYVGCVMAVEVDTGSGEIRVTDCWLAQDCGQVVNPDGVRLQAEGCVIQTLSRTLSEEIRWEGNEITTLDWGSYPLLTFPQVPRIEVVIMDRQNDPMWGAGEPAVAVITPAVGNAVFDATGVRLREAPFTPDRVKAALATG
jgi:CO/xanthine dehydrogenase Mo-binding subunit